MLPDGLETVNQGAFEGCTALTKINIPDSVKAIGDSAFKNCTSLEKLVLPDGLERIDSYAFNGCTALDGIKIPNSVVNIGSGVFDGCDKILEEMEKQDGILYLDNWAIKCDADIKNLSFRAGTKGIASGLGYGDALETVVIPSSLEYAPVFPKSGNLKSVKFEDNSRLTKLSSYAFKNCPKLETIDFGKNSALNMIPNDCFEGCVALKKITIPSEVTNLGASVFANCAKLEAVIFPDGSKLSSIGSSAFANCTSLKSVDIPNGVDFLAYSLFKGSAIEKLTIPESVSTISFYAFQDCAALDEVIFAKTDNWALYNTSGDRGLLYEVDPLILSDPQKAAELVKSLEPDSKNNIIPKLIRTP